MREDVTLLKFGATWCAPCKQMAQRLEKFDACPVREIDIETDDMKDLGLIDKFQIMSVPVMILVDKDNNEIKRWVGLTNIADIEKAVINN